jgi:hypothetical protein
MRLVPTCGSGRLVLSLLLSTGLCSCASDPSQPLADGLMGPKDARRPAPESGISRSSATPQAGESCSRVESIVPTDVDTAYARVMGRLRFRTLDERKRFAEQYSSGLMDEGFRHTAQSGAYYRLADLVGWNGPGALARLPGSRSNRAEKALFAPGSSERTAFRGQTRTISTVHSALPSNGAFGTP